MEGLHLGKPIWMWLYYDDVGRKGVYSLQNRVWDLVESACVELQRFQVFSAFVARME